MPNPRAILRLARGIALARQIAAEAESGLVYHGTTLPTARNIMSKGFQSSSEAFQGLLDQVLRREGLTRWPGPRMASEEFVGRLSPYVSVSPGAGTARAYAGMGGELGWSIERKLRAFRHGDTRLEIFRRQLKPWDVGPAHQGVEKQAPVGAGRNAFMQLMNPSLPEAPSLWPSTLAEIQGLTKARSGLEDLPAVVQARLTDAGMRQYGWFGRQNTASLRETLRNLSLSRADVIAREAERGTRGVDPDWVRRLWRKDLIAKLASFWGAFRELQIPPPYLAPRKLYAGKELEALASRLKPVGLPYGKLADFLRKQGH